MRLEPQHAPALSNLGYVQFKYLGRAEEGEENLRRAVQAQPGFAAARLNLGMLLQERGLLDEALSAYQEALRREPDLAEARLNRALIWLARGDFARGWPQYEARKGGSAHFTPRNFPFPEWDGKPAPGRTVLVYGEQGLGDEIMFASCLPDVIARTGRCVIDCAPQLAPLFRRSFPTAAVHGGRQDASDLAWLDGVGAGRFSDRDRQPARAFPDEPRGLSRSSGYLKADESAVGTRRRGARLPRDLSRLEGRGTFPPLAQVESGNGQREMGCRPFPGTPMGDYARGSRLSGADRVRRRPCRRIRPAA